MSAFEQLRAAREGAKRTDQYVVQEAKKIIDQVSEEEYREIVSKRRDDFVVGPNSSGYEDGGKEFWEGTEAARERARLDEIDRQAFAAAKAAEKVVKEPTPVQAPVGRVALMGAFRSGAMAEVPAKVTKQEQRKDIDDMLQQMCGELEAEGSSITAAPPKRKLEGTTAAAPRANKRQTKKGPAPEDVKMEVEVKKEPAVVIKKEPQEVKLDNTTPVKMEEAVKQEVSDALTSIKKEPGTASTSGEGIIEWLAGASCSESAAQAALSSPTQEPDGGLWFFFVDAFEDDRSNPPRVYLFGKVRVSSQGGSTAPEYRSCCLVVEKLERCIHLLLNPKDLDDETSVREAATAAEEEFDKLCQQHAPGVKKLRAKLKWRNYAFEKALPTGTGNLPFLKVICDSSGTTPPVGLCGHNFSHSFGVNTSLLERLVLTKRIMGPSWIRLSAGSWTEDPARLSYCAVELRITPQSIEVPRNEESRQRLAETMPSSSPPLRMMSISLQTWQANAQQSHEALAIACSLHPQVSPDASESEKELRSGMILWKAVRRFDAKPFPRDAEKVLASAGVQSFNNEVALLNAFLAKVQEFDPDVIAGHNAYGFDLDVISNRLHQLKIAQWQKFGRLRRPKDRVPRVESRQSGGFWVGTNLAAGRLVCDVLLQARDLLPKLGSYDLPSLAREQLGDQQLRVVEPEQLPSCYDSAKSLTDLANHTLHSALCIARVAQSLQILPLTRQLTNLAGNLWNASLQNKRAERNEFLLCHEFHGLKFVVPDKESANSKKRRLHAEGAAGLDDPDGDGEQAASGRRGKAAYSGGLVLEPKAGLYDDFVMLLDFNSLYPSIIQEFNICFTTVDRPDETEVAQIAGEADLLARTKEPDGTVQGGVLPQVLRRLVDSRRSVKASMKSEKDARKIQILEIRQKALKLTANSMYGCLGFQNSRFYAKPLAALITAKGREALQSTISVVQQELQLDVVYGDTDSVFVNTRTTDFDQAMQAAEQIKRSVNKRYKRLEIEIDAVFVRLMLLKKKKYAAMKVVDWKSKKFEVECKGLDIVRRDWCGIAKEIGEEILHRVLNASANKEEAVNWVHQFLADKAAEIDELKVPVEKYIITKALTKDPKDYPDAKNQPHVQVALRLMARGKPVRTGQEIEYVICDVTGEGTKSLLAEKARDPHELKMDQSLRLDIAWYKKQQIHPLVSRLLAVVEGTSPARIAECLGMDTSRFTQMANARDSAEGGHAEFEPFMEAAGANISAIFDRKSRWKSFGSTLPGVKCLKCNETTSWKQLLVPEVESSPEAPKGMDKTPLPFCCRNCSSEVHPRRAQNLFVIQLRQMLKEHCEGWVHCQDDSHFIEKTRRLSRGQNLMSEKSVLRELEFALYLCESLLDDSMIQDGDMCRDAAEGMKRATQRLMDCNGQNWVDCGQIFGNIFGAGLALPIGA